MKRPLYLCIVGGDHANMLGADPGLGQPPRVRECGRCFALVALAVGVLVDALLHAAAGRVYQHQRP